MTRCLRPFRLCCAGRNRAMTLRQAALSFREQVTPQQAVGRVAACSASPCPPGVPVVLAGERIDQTAASLLIRRGFSAVEVVAAALS